MINDLWGKWIRTEYQKTNTANKWDKERRTLFYNADPGVSCVHVLHLSLIFHGTGPFRILPEIFALVLWATPAKWFDCGFRESPQTDTA